MTTVGGGAIAPAVSVPANAKNVILDIAYIDWYYGCFFTSLNAGLSGGSNTYYEAGPHEYRFGYANKGHLGTDQVTIPLSASATGELSFYLRGWSALYHTCDIRVLGWTL